MTREEINVGVYTLRTVGPKKRMRKNGQGKVDDFKRHFLIFRCWLTSITGLFLLTGVESFLSFFPATCQPHHLVMIVHNMQPYSRRKFLCHRVLDLL